MCFSADRLLARKSYPSIQCGVGFAMLAIVFLLPAVTLQGQIVDWNNNSGARLPFYDAVGNWNGGARPGSGATARFNLAGTYDVWWDGFTPGNTPDVGFVQVLQGDVTFENVFGAQHLFTINGSNSTEDFSVSGSNTSLTIRGLHLESLGGGEILNGATLTLDGSHPVGTKLTVGGSIGFDVSGNLNVQSGAIFENTDGSIARNSGSAGTATVTGSGSQWNNSGKFVGGPLRQWDAEHRGRGPRQ